MGLPALPGRPQPRRLVANLFKASLLLISAPLAGASAAGCGYDPALASSRDPVLQLHGTGPPSSCAAGGVVLDQLLLPGVVRGLKATEGPAAAQEKAVRNIKVSHDSGSVQVAVDGAGLDDGGHGGDGSQAYVWTSSLAGRFATMGGVTALLALLERPLTPATAAALAPAITTLIEHDATLQALIKVRARVRVISHRVPADRDAAPHAQGCLPRHRPSPHCAGGRCGQAGARAALWLHPWRRRQRRVQRVPRCPRGPAPARPLTLGKAAAGAEAATTTAAAERPFALEGRANLRVSLEVEHAHFDLTSRRNEFESHSSGSSALCHTPHTHALKRGSALECFSRARATVVHRRSHWRTAAAGKRQQRQDAQFTQEGGEEGH